jgi:hypothetical protein
MTMKANISCANNIHFCVFNCITQDLVSPFSHIFEENYTIFVMQPNILRKIGIKILLLLWRRKPEMNLVSFSRKANALTEPGRTIQGIGQWKLKVTEQYVSTGRQEVSVLSLKCWQTEWVSTVLHRLSDVFPHADREHCYDTGHTMSTAHTIKWQMKWLEEERSCSTDQPQPHETWCD